jgi:hypothetical protein
VGYFTQTQIEAKITEISSAIDVVTSGGRTYRLNDGMGDVQVTRETLTNLHNALDYWLAKYDEIGGDSGIISIKVSR